MSVAVFVVSHHQIGHALVEAVTTTFGGELPLPVQAYGVPSDADPDTLYPKVRKMVEALDQGDGVLILTDLFGSTPCNICNHLDTSTPITVVTGLNLPMLIRVMNYPNQSLPDLAQTARTGGQEGIVTCDNSQQQP